MTRLGLGGVSDYKYIVYDHHDPMPACDALITVTSLAPCQGNCHAAAGAGSRALHWQGPGASLRLSELEILTR